MHLSQDTLRKRGEQPCLATSCSAGHNYSYAELYEKMYLNTYFTAQTYTDMASPTTNRPNSLMNFRNEYRMKFGNRMKLRNFRNCFHEI